MLSSFRPPANASDGSSTATTPSGAARAYNGWLAETYLGRDTRFKGIAIVPMHDADAALEELRHAYTSWACAVCFFPRQGCTRTLEQNRTGRCMRKRRAWAARSSFTAVAIGTSVWRR